MQVFHRKYAFRQLISVSGPEAVKSLPMEIFRTQRDKPLSTLICAGPALARGLAQMTPRGLFQLKLRRRFSDSMKSLVMLGLHCSEDKKERYN